MLRKLLNLGILAHVDAGKTTLTERLLYAAGVIDAVGSVDKGTTRTDSLALEQQRGITIKSAVVSFPVDDVTVNLIDTPGHPDFIAEVERVLSVLDGCVLVISAVEGVQPQTRILMRALQRLEVPTLLFVNKIDRAGADPERVLDEIEQRLTPTSCRWAGRRARYASRVVRVVRARRRRPRRRARAGRLHPVFFGSAITGAGVEEVRGGIAHLPAGPRGDGEGPLSACVFKIERGPDGDRIAYTRVFSGSVKVRDRLDAGKVTAIRASSRTATPCSETRSSGRDREGLGPRGDPDRRLARRATPRGRASLRTADVRVGRRACRSRRRRAAARRARAAREAGPV